MADGTSDKSNVVALVLCFFFGFVGAHRYYVGKIGTGVAQLLCCALPIVVAFLLYSGVSGSAILPLAVVALAALGGLVVWNLVDCAMIVMQKFTDSRGDVLKFN